MKGTHYNPSLCAYPGCDAFALTGAEYCWEHLTDKAAYVTVLLQTDMADAWLQGIDLSGLDLGGMDLRGARLSGACLRNVNLRNADLRRRQSDGRGPQRRQSGIFGTGRRGPHGGETGECASAPRQSGGRGRGGGGFFRSGYVLFAARQRPVCKCLISRRENPARDIPPG